MPANEPTRGRSSPRGGGQPGTRRITILVRATVIIVALVTGGYLFRQGELSRHLSDPVAAVPSRPAPAVPSRPARARPSPAATPTAAVTPLPPVSTAPGIVRAIDAVDPALPSGYTRETFSAAQLGTSAGFTIASPPGWRLTSSGRQVKLEGPDGSYVEIDLSRHVRSDLVSEARYLETARGPDFPGYQRIYSPPDQPLKKFIQPETIHQTLGALWEFDWVTPGSVRLREDVLLFDLGRQSYTIFTAGPAGRNDNSWNLATLGTVSTMLRTFQAVTS